MSACLRKISCLRIILNNDFYISKFWVAENLLPIIEKLNIINTRKRAIKILLMILKLCIPQYPIIY